MSRRTSPTMLPSRTRPSADSTIRPRHTPRTLPQATALYTHIPAMDHANYHLVSAAPMSYPIMAQGFPPDLVSYYPPNDGSYIPASNISPNELEFAQCYGTEDSGYNSMSSSSSESSDELSPPMTDAELTQTYFTQEPYLAGTESYSCQDQWLSSVPQCPVTPPPEDQLDLFTNHGTGLLPFQSLPEPAIQQCEYLGESSLQFSRAAVRPRQIRCASTRSPPSSTTGSPTETNIGRVKVNPRNDPRYDAKPDKDGYYHCPYAKGPEVCTHKPTKQKCIYAKNLDSHLKPYTCKVLGDENCRNQRFSSNACLFRHEREMHGLHNHGKNPYPCLFDNCERSRGDNGFPRRWNQRDHMKRVHGWEGEINGDDADQGYNEPTRRRKGPVTSSSVAMKRTSSARAHPYHQGTTRTASTPRYNTQMRRDLQAQSTMMPGMIDPAQYGPIVTQSYGQPRMYAAY